MRPRTRLVTLVLCGIMACLRTDANAADLRVTLTAADVDRAGQVIVFPLPVGAGKVAALRGEDGKMLPLQVERDGTARFVMPWQPAKKEAVFVLVEATSGAETVVVGPDAGNLAVSIGGSRVLGYRMDKEALPRPEIKPEYKRAGYLFPVLSPSGQRVVDDFPPQHIHHHGIWAPWTKTSFQGRAPDFWNMGAKTGTVEFVALDRTWNGPVHGGFQARHRMVDLSAPSPVTALHETWSLTAYNLQGVREPVRMFELDITQTCATEDPLILPEYRYGGLGYRGREEWFGEKNSRFLTSEGITDRVKAHGYRARWIAQHGPAESGVVSLAILGHPGNFRAPQPLRVHPKEPFVNFAPSQLGEWRIEPGKPYVARYRFIVTDRASDASLLEAYWHGYASPAAVRIHP